MADITRHGVTIKEALQEAAATARIDRVMLACYELWHESFADPIRFVNNNAAFSATLESTAPRDPSTLVEFLACPMEKSQPEESDTVATPTITLTRPDVAGIIKEALDAARGSVEPWILIERLYASDDTSEPALLPPMTFEVTSFDLSMGLASMAASFGDWVNVGIPRTTFQRSQYPGLQR